MKNLLAFSALLLSSGVASAQLGLGTNAPHPSAMLDVASTTRGLLPPRMTEAQRNAIQNPANGLIVYQTDSTGTSTAGLYLRGASGWSKSGMGPAGGDLTGTYPNPSIANGAVTTAKISAAGAQQGDVLTYAGQQVVWATPSAGGADQTTAGNGLNEATDQVRLGGTLDQPTEIATAGNNLTLSGTGSFGVGLPTATAPLSTIETGGSFGGPILVVTSNIGVLNASHFTIIFEANNTNAQATLPPASTAKNRIYRLVNRSNGGTNSLYTKDLGQIWYPRNNVPTTFLQQTFAVTLQSDGVNWYQIGG